MLTIFGIKKVAHPQKTFFDRRILSVDRYPIYRIEFGEKFENFLPVLSTAKN
jgi:hypothetical protein